MLSAWPTWSQSIVTPEVLNCRYVERTSLRLSWPLVLGLLVFFCLWSPPPASAQVPREFQVKADFIFNFAQYTEWPTNLFATTNAPLVIGVLGTNPFGDILEKTVKGESVRGCPLQVRYYRTVEEIKTCHILYIGQSEAPRLDHVLAVLKKRPILTVSDIEGSAYHGVMIRFLTERNKIRFRINLEAVKAANLTLSSKLLRLAEEIIPAEQK